VQRKVRIQERSFTMGNIVGVNAYRVNRALLKQRFVQEGGYQLHETEHFLLFTRDQAPKTVLVHWFAPEEIDANIGDTFLAELKAPGLLQNEHHFGDVFGAVVFSLFPSDPMQGMSIYGKNTLRRYQQLLENGSSHFLPSESTISRFAEIYRRIFQLHVGRTFLDVGCSFGFLPLLLAAHDRSLEKVMGVDIQTEHFDLVRTLAKEQGLHNVQFVRANVLSDDFPRLGQFDTVVALHVLEHFSQEEMYRALSNLLQVTVQRLIIAVPYEPDEPEHVYGHQQVFTPAYLEEIGRWCLKQWDGRGKMSVETCAGGLLLLEKTSLTQEDMY